MSILVNTGFKVGSAAPLNEYSIRETVDDRDALVTDGYVYEGMEVYCKDTKIKYRWTGVTWNEIGSGGTVDLSGYAKTYTTLEDLGLTAPVTVGEIFNAMPSKTMAVLSCEAKDESVGTVTVSDIPESYGILTIKKNGVGRLSIEYQNSSYNTACNVKKWIGTLKGADGTGLVWKQLSSEPTFTTLSDIGLTADATFQDVVDALPKGGSALLGVKNFTNYQTIFPYEEGNDQFARVYIVKGIEDGSNVYARWFRKDGVKEAIANFNISDNKFSGWQKIQTEIVDNLTSIDTDKPLSANQGKILKDELGLKANKMVKKASLDVDDLVDEGSYYVMEARNAPEGHGWIDVLANTNYTIQLFYPSLTTNCKMYIRRRRNGGAWESWQKVSTTSVADVKETSIAFDETALGLTISNSRSLYKVINGICYVTIELHINAPSDYKTYGYTRINTTSLPKIGAPIKGVLNVVEANSSISVVLDRGDTGIKLHGNILPKEGTYTIQGSISYPVAE